MRSAGVCEPDHSVAVDLAGMQQDQVHGPRQAMADRSGLRPAAIASSARGNGASNRLSSSWDELCEGGRSRGPRRITGFTSTTTRANAVYPLATTPDSVTGLFESYSAANE